MRLYTRQDMTNVAAERFGKAYARSLHDSAAWQPGKTKAQIFEALEALGANPNPDDVDRIIGNGSWTRETCSCCYQQPTRWASVDVTHGEYGTSLCEECVKKIAALF